MTEFALADILSLKRWEHALFTTYALSLTFFESYVLRFLRQQGCREIFLITDVDGYQMSLSERRSNRVGHEYRLIPVALPKGVFHPKCMYFSSKEGDLLAIGSGNMTFGGFGRNLEVFDILEPSDAPQAFIDFADFLELLENREDFILPDKSWINRFANFARNRATGQFLTDNNNSRLLHTVVEPIIDQIEKICSAHKGGSKLTVLSPFHDPAGTAIYNLASRTAVKHIEISLPPKLTNNTTFPFPKTASWGIPISAVKPVALNYERPLHAKWIEIVLRDGRTLTLTGSVNATQKALCSIDNIEVGILRITDDDTSWITWEKAQIPTSIDKHTYRAGGLGQKCLIHASIRNNGIINGSILASGKVDGEWSGYLENSAADQIPLTLQVSDNNSFEQVIQAGEYIIYSSGLQMILTQGDRLARGWVNHEDLLNLSHEQRLIIRLINREETIEDDIALLDYLSLSANRHLSAFAKPISLEKKKPNAETADGLPRTIVKLVDISPDDRMLFSHELPAPTNIQGDHFNDIFTELRRRLLGNKINNAHKIMEGGEDDPKHLKDKHKILRKLSDRLDYFDACIKECVNNAQNEASKRAALVIWFEVKLHMLQRHQEKDKAVSFIREWFRKVCSQKLQAKEMGPLDQHIFTVAAVCASLVTGVAKENEELVELHEGLERFTGGDINRTRAEKALLDHSEIGFSAFLLGTEDNSLLDSLKKVLATETIRHMLIEALESYNKGREINDNALVFSSGIGKEFLYELKHARKPQYKEMYNGLPVCAFCYIELTVPAQQDLKYRRIARCHFCNRFTVNLCP